MRLEILDRRFGTECLVVCHAALRDESRSTALPRRDLLPSRALVPPLSTPRGSRVRRTPDRAFLHTRGAAEGPGGSQRKTAGGKRQRASPPMSPCPWRGTSQRVPPSASGSTIATAPELCKNVLNGSDAVIARRHRRRGVGPASASCYPIPITARGRSSGKLDSRDDTARPNRTRLF
jgi:hypothetical protein